MKDLIGLIAASLAIIAYIPYFRDIIKGKSKPHAFSWFVWGAVSALIFMIQISHGAGAGSWTTGTVVVLSFIVLLLSLKNGLSYVTKADTVCLLLSIIAAIIWLFAKQPLLSMILLVATDMLGIVPSVRKSWHRPYEETVFMWIVNGVRHALSLFAITAFTLTTALNPLVWAVTNIAFAGMLFVRRGRAKTVT